MEEMIEENITPDPLLGEGSSSVNDSEQEMQGEGNSVTQAIPNVYYYDKDTKEYLYSRQADKDPAKSEQMGYFVPMVHANSTLIEPPECGENEVAVYNSWVDTSQDGEVEAVNEDDSPNFTASGEVQTSEAQTIKHEEWQIKPDYRQNFLKVDYNLNVFDITTIGDEELKGFILVTKEEGEDIKAHKDWYKIIDEEVVKKSDDEITTQELEQAKMLKISENDRLRDEALNAGVEYKGILFDSDTDQKINLLATVSMMNSLPTGEGSSSVNDSELEMQGEGTITWYGKNNEPLECTVDDLTAIGGLITELHTFCWTKNAEIKSEIATAESIEELEAVEICYKR